MSTATAEKNGTTLSEALRLAADGYEVFPCGHNKAPLGALAPNGCKDATSDPETIKRWWGTNPNANVGLVCNGLVAVDDDRPKKDLPAWLADDPDKAYDLAGVPLQQTPSGGRHYFFRQPESKQRRARQQKPTVDYVAMMNLGGRD